MRIIGLDYGTKTVGVAVSDALMITAQPLETIERKSANKLRQTLARIESIIEEYQAERIVLGYPKNMNNTIGERAEATEQFKEDLERRTGLEVITFAGTDQCINHAQCITRMYIVINITVNQQQIAFQLFSNLRIGRYLVNKGSISLFAYHFLYSVMRFAPPTVINIIIMVSGT